jgi:hypothetical protein
LAVVLLLAATSVFIVSSFLTVDPRRRFITQVRLRKRVETSEKSIQRERLVETNIMRIH